MYNITHDLRMNSNDTCTPQLNMCWYYVCDANEFLVKTGLGIRDIFAAKKCMRWPFQKVQFINLNPNDYTFDLNNMSKELVPFKLPMVFTIGPIDPSLDMDGFLRYTRSMCGMTQEQIKEIVSGVVHGETRVLSAKLTVEEMFSDRLKFKTDIQEKVEELLKAFGLHVANCNIAEMKDLDNDNKYFYNLKQKALEQASNQAKIDIAEEKKKGNVGEKQRNLDAEVLMKDIEAKTTQQKNEKEKVIAESNKILEVAKYAFKQEQETKRIETQNAPLQRGQELKSELEQKTALAKLEELRAVQLAQTKVDAEKAVEKADGEARAVERTAEATLFKSKKDAEGILAKATAEAEGLQRFLNINNPEMVKFFLAVDRNVFVDMAQKTADAIKGLEPKINIWNTGNQDDNQPYNALNKLFTSLPPMLDAVQSQTNIKLPNWMPQMTA